MSEPVVYLNGHFLPKSQAAISPDDRGFLFADGIYEVLRAVNGALFETDAHVVRLARNASDIGLCFERPQRVVEIGRRLLEENDLRVEDAAVYVQVTRGRAKRTHAFPQPPVEPTLYVHAFPFERRRRWHTEGVSIVTVPDTRWTRCDIKSISLLPNVLAAEHAHAAGADEAVFVRDEAVLEGAHSSFFGVLDGVLTTAPLSSHILPGITRSVVLAIARDVEIPTAERPILYSELGEARELFLTGTTTDVAPIVQCDGQPIAGGEPGPVTRRLQDALFDRLSSLGR